MKKIIIYFFMTVLFIFSLFSLFGVIAMFLSENIDFLGVAFFLICFLCGLYLSFVLKGKLDSISKSFKESESDNYFQSQKHYNSNYLSDNFYEFESPVSSRVSFPDSYIVFDVETPNRSNDRICQIGVIVVRNGVIVDNFSSIINPETYFDQINITITGIDSDSVLNCPTFPEYWSKISKLFISHTVVAHNATFDLNVLCKTLVHYHIDVPNMSYLCTLEISKNNLSFLKQHSLTALAAHYKIPYPNQHNALSDAMVCFRVFEKLKDLSGPLLPEPFIFPSDRSADRASSESSSYTIDYDQDNDTIDIPYSSCSSIDISNNRFVLTGIFTLSSKSKITDFIISNGGIVTTAVSGKTNYLIVGSNSEPAWKHGNYGRKIEKAFELINSGNSLICIITESDFLNLTGLK